MAEKVKKAKAKSPEIKVRVTMFFQISLWQAIKIRIGGKNLIEVVEEIKSQIDKSEVVK